MFGWLKDHWKTIAVIAVSTVVFAAVTVATGGLGAPALVALASGGFASGVAGYGLDRWLNDQPFSVKDALVSGAVSTAVTVGTFGLGRVLAPALRPIANRAAPVLARMIPVGTSSVVPRVLTTAATNAAIGGGLGGAIKAGENVVRGRPIGDGVGDAVAVNAINGALVGPLANRIMARGTPTPTEPPPPVNARSGGNGASTPGVAKVLQDLDAAAANGGSGKNNTPTTPVEPARVSEGPPPKTYENTPPPSRGPPRPGTLGEEPPIDANVVSAKPIGGSANKVYKVRLADGSEHIVKGESIPAKLTGKMFGISSQNRAEVAAYKIDQQMGLGMVPETRLSTYEGRPVVVQEFAEGAVLPSAVKGTPVANTPYHRAQLADMKAFDYVIRNLDRHSKNYLVDPNTGRVVLIDNGLSQASWRPFYRSGGMPGEVTRSFLDKLGRLDPATLQRELVGEGLLSSGEVNAMIARARQILDGARSGRITVIDG